MSYFDIPSTYKTEGSVIFPTSHQEYKQRQKVDYGNFNSLEYRGSQSNPQKPNQYFSSWGSAKNNVVQFNPSIVNDGMVMYYSKNNYMNSKDRDVSPHRSEGLRSINNNYSKTSLAADNKHSQTLISDSGRRIAIPLESPKINSRSKVSAFPYLDSNFTSTPDYTDTDTKHSQKTVSEYFKNHNQFQTEEFITPGTKIIKLESGRTITFDIKPEMKEIARCPRPETNNLEITPNKYGYNVNEYSVGKFMSDKRPMSEGLKDFESKNQFPLSGLSGANVPDGMYNKTAYSIQQALNKNIRGYDKEQSLEDPKLLIPTNEIETKIKNVPTSIANYSVPFVNQNVNQNQFINQNQNVNQNQHSLPQYQNQFINQNQHSLPQYQNQFINQHSLAQNQQKYTNPKDIEKFTLNKPDMADELYKQILRTSAKTVCDFLLNFKPYRPWMKHWKILEDNLKKTNLNISKLPTTDKEIAYTLDKGEVIKFRWEDEKRFIPKDVYMYVLLHELTHESFPPSFQGHGDPFPQMLCLLCVAATEIGILDIQNIPKNIYMSNGRPITSRESIKTEIMFGIEMLIEANKNDEQIVEYYNAKIEFVNKYS